MPIYRGHTAHHDPSGEEFNWDRFGHLPAQLRKKPLGPADVDSVPGDKMHLRHKILQFLRQDQNTEPTVGLPLGKHSSCPAKSEQTKDTTGPGSSIF